MRARQRGATLIVVLVLLVAITIIGTLAIRQSMVALNIATNGQAQQLLMQNSDSVFFNTEDANNLIQSLGTNGMFGYISNDINKDVELVFCYRGDQASFFDLNRASLIEWERGKTAPTNNKLGLDGYCDVSATDTNFFTSGRRAVITQVAVKFPSSSSSEILSDLPEGGDPELNKTQKIKRVSIYAVSLMPTLSTRTDAEINTCLNSRMNQVTIPNDIAASIPANAVVRQSVTSCLSSINVPFTTLVTDYTIEQSFK
ncbi:pilus assembly protein PilX [Acinetobacter radioresistens]|uniref:PilX N-terminal domain-containing pilus assembly protein n=1 Tax=Acinetobacter TaxID=469 RepID=UPI000449C1DA|nr:MULTISPECIES: PilX N-terminal domain-containing pilus assembly protein [Acinetobacter]EXF58530.1 putative type 4 fimbrial biogenesis protein PilX [Acinetobacter sp. 1294596]MCK4110511.1 pilus assembly protein PilX [Acinetobacter radioresistens]MCU4384525.1 pilus assembly protein PilX [Acinetobacter radioresistens]MCU4498930.1 pilus assembly protein PilX [Acinetobacter radioresistens]NTY96218.1 pilus assembly protein PilX [Acinetobacter radioresistens]